MTFKKRRMRLEVEENAELRKETFKASK